MNQSVKVFSAIACAVALASTVFSNRAEAQSSSGTVATPPVGFVNITVPAAVNSNQTGNVVVGFSLQDSPVFTGTASAVGSNTITTGSGGWTNSQFVTSPYFVRLTSGSSTGRSFLVTANTTSQVTVDSEGTTLSTSFSVGNSFEIFPARTLGSLFGTGTTQLQANTDVTIADNVLIWNGASYDTFYHNGTNWRKVGSFSNQNTAIVYPQESIFIIRRALSPVTITVLGAVPTTSLVTTLPATGGDMVSNRFPTDTTLLGTGLAASSSWVKNTDVTLADNVLIWNGSAWDTYYHNGTNWRKVGSFSSQDSFTISQGTGFFVRRATGASQFNLSQALPYTL